jgi:ketosteroid isomerase-like protein
VTRDQIELVRTAFSHYEARDLDQLLALAHPDIEFDPVFVSGRYRGVEQVRALLEPVPGVRGQWSASDLEYVGVGGHVVVTGRLHSHTTFGAPLDLPIALLFEIKLGLITRVEGHMTLREAIQAAGRR